jgi:hypothetical protein
MVHDAGHPDSFLGGTRVFEVADELGVHALGERHRHARELDELVGSVTSVWNGYELMGALRAAGVPAGVCQTAEDRSAAA